MVRGVLDMAGYTVTEAANQEEAIRKLEQQPVDLVLAALDLPPAGGGALFQAMRQRLEWKKIPFLALADSAEQLETAAARAGDFDDVQAKFERALVLQSIARLMAPASRLALVTAGR
jgi:CheY-like chemotaxis protein